MNKEDIQLMYNTLLLLTYEGYNHILDLDREYLNQKIYSNIEPKEFINNKDLISIDFDTWVDKWSYIESDVINYKPIFLFVDNVLGMSDSLYVNFRYLHKYYIKFIGLENLHNNTIILHPILREYSRSYMRYINSDLNLYNIKNLL